MKKIVFVFAMLTGVFGNAQDPHFSQYYASQSTVNPATAGMFRGDMRVSGLYRQQWPEFGSAFVTGTVAMEIKPGGFKDGENPNRLALGATLLQDKTPDQVLTGQFAYVTLAYHKALDEEGHSRLGIGFMAGYNQRMLDATKLSFASQFGSGGFVNGGGESIASHKTTSLDVHAGLLYSFEDDDRLLYAGAAVYHLMKPKDYFLQQNSIVSHVPMRFNFNAGFNVRTESLHYAGSVLVMRQQQASEIMAGGAIGVPFSTDGTLYGGAWYRTGGSVIPTINLEWKNTNLGFSYDTYILSKNTLTRPKSFEMSLSYRVAPVRDTKTGCFAF